MMFFLLHVSPAVNSEQKYTAWKYLYPSKIGLIGVKKYLEPL